MLKNQQQFSYLQIVLECHWDAVWHSKKIVFQMLIIHQLAFQIVSLDISKLIANRMIILV